MLLRWIVSNFVQQAARQQLQDLVAEAVGMHAPRRDADGLAAEGGEDGASVPEEPPLCDVACLFALSVESGGLADLLQNAASRRYGSYTGQLGQLGAHRVLVANTGVGGKAAARATAEVLARHQPAWIISTGFAGGLTPDMRRGHMLMADCVADSQSRLWEVGLKVDPAALPRSVHVGRLLTVDQLIRTSDEKRRLAEAHGALACDMESAAVAEVCRQTRTRFLAVRIISDGLDDQLPAEVEKLMHQQNLASTRGAATAAIWNRPSTVKDLWQLKQEALKASDRLARFLAGVIDQLEGAGHNRSADKEL